MILFICSREEDYLQDLTFSGLCSVLGCEHIVDFPFHWQYHRRKKHLWSQPNRYPKSIGFCPPDAEFSNARANDRRRGADFKLAVLASAKPDALDRFESAVEQPGFPWIFLDGGDWPGIGGDFKRLGGAKCLARFESLCRKAPPALIFKRELSPELRSDRVFPFPFSIDASQVSPIPPRGEKKYQVLFRAVESSPTRRKAFELLADKYDCAENGSVPGQKFRKYKNRGQDYLEELAQARMALSFRGEGFDTLRFWEVPASGSLLLSEKPTIEIPDPFTHGRNAVFCENDLSDLLPLIDHYLAHPDEAVQIAQEGQRHLLNHHTHIHRARYLLEILETRLKLKF